MGYNGENQLRAEGATSAQAWLQAVEQARLLGLRVALEQETAVSLGAARCQLG
jgi:hypothetical protein